MSINFLFPRNIFIFNWIPEKLEKMVNAHPQEKFRILLFPENLRSRYTKYAVVDLHR